MRVACGSGRSAGGTTTPRPQPSNTRASRTVRRIRLLLKPVCFTRLTRTNIVGNMIRLGNGQWAVGNGIAALVIATSCADAPAPDGAAFPDSAAPAPVAAADSGQTNAFDPGSVV